MMKQDWENWFILFIHSRIPGFDRLDHYSGATPVSRHSPCLLPSPSIVCSPVEYYYHAVGGPSALPFGRLSPLVTLSLLSFYSLYISPLICLELEISFALLHAWENSLRQVFVFGFSFQILGFSVSLPLLSRLMGLRSYG